MARIKGLREQQQRTMQLDGEQAAPSASAQPVTQQADTAIVAGAKTIQQDAQQAPSATTVQQQKQASQAASRRQDTTRNAARLLAQRKLGPQQQPAPSTQTHNTSPGIMLDPPIVLGTQVTDKAVDLTQTRPQGAYPLDRAELQEVQQDLASTAILLADAAKRQDAAGNTAFAHELLEHAQYAAECAKTFGHCLCAKLDEKLIGILNNGPFMKTLREIRNPNRPAATAKPVVALTEQKYNGFAQEVCAQAGFVLYAFGKMIIYNLSNLII